MSTGFLKELFDHSSVASSDILRLEVEANEPPPDDLVLCRDHGGNATAVYGKSVWDLNPFRLSAKKVPKFYFNSIFPTDCKDSQSLVLQTKYLMFCLIAYVGSGNVGRLSPGMLYVYFVTLRTIARFCYAQKENKLVGVISFEQLFTNPVYFGAFIRAHAHLGGSQKSLIRALPAHLIAIGERRLGYRVQGTLSSDFDSMSKSQQHPVIPTRIYLEMLNMLGDEIDKFYQHRKKIEQFLGRFAHVGYGTSSLHQINVLGYDRADIQPNFKDAINAYDLNEIFVGDFECKNRGYLSAFVLKIQWLVKWTIHAYTGMRDQEVMRLPYSCLAREEVIPATVDDRGILRDKAKFVDLISTTTKFEGYRKQEAWLAPVEVLKAVKIAQAVCCGLSKIYRVDVRALPLFVNPSVVSRRDSDMSPPIWNNSSMPRRIMCSIKITAPDLEELVSSSPDRNFYNEKQFSVGSPWPFTSHQFRRSLAFYASSSGFVSLPSLKKQFKHLTLQMARYYTNHFEKLKTIFGFFDERTKEFILPKNHMAFEFQMGISMNVAYDLITELLGNANPLFGGVGGYVEKQRERLKDGEVSIAAIKAETLKRVSDGRLSYRPTLLGGCTKAGQCDEYMLGDYTACLGCEGAIIKPEAVAAAIVDADAELSGYQEDSGEYQVIMGERDRLIKFHSRLILPKEKR